MALSLQQVQKQTQKLIMTPQMQQSIQLLQMTTMELEQLATQEMMENPFLELLDDEEQLDADNSAAAADLAETDPRQTDTDDPASRQDSDAPSEPAPSETADGAPDDDASDGEPRDEEGRLESPDPDTPDDDVYSYDATAEKREEAPSEEPATFDSVDVDWDDQYSDSENAAYRSREDEEERDFTQYTALHENLYENLTRQLHLSSLAGEGFRIGEFLIGNLNEDGLFDCSPRGLLELLQVPVELLVRNPGPEELRQAVATLMRVPLVDLRHVDAKQLYFLGVATLLGVDPPELTGRSRRELEIALLGHRMGLPEEEVAETDPRELFLLAVARRFGVERDAVEDALDVVQEFSPTGIGARDLAECLRLQAEDQGIRNGLLYRILDEALGLLQQKKFKEIAVQLGCTEEDAVAVFQIVSRMEPRPGRSICRDSVQYIQPDVYVKKIDGKYLYYLNEGDTGRLKISSRYRRMLRNPALNGRDREYAEGKLRSATWLIKNIEKRKSTILRVTEAIMMHQQEFLEKGLEFLRPLTLREIADVVGMHESTIARVTSGKYVETPRGTFELKFFFSSSLETDEGENASSRSIKEMVARMIENENGKRPFSDQKIADALKAKGINIARRTVAKYREQLRILPAKLRRQTG